MENEAELKFLMVTTFYPPYNFGGDGIYIYRLSHELASRGHQVDIVHCLDAYNLLGRNRSKGDYPAHEKINVYPLKSRVGFMSPLFTQQTGHSFFKKDKIQALISEKKYDVIHYHNISLIGLEALSLGQAIKLYHIHDHWLICPMHVLWKYNRKLCRKKNCVFCQFVGKRPVQLWRFTNMLRNRLSHVDMFLSPSRFAMARHQAEGWTIPIVHYPNFLPAPADQAPVFKRSNEINDRPYFLIVGRLEKIKGVQTVIPVFKNYPDYDLLIAGEGNYESELKASATNVSNIKFMGRIPYGQLQSLYRHAIATIVPSICYEIFPLVLIESFSQRTPVVVNNLGGLPEIVNESGGGFIFSDKKDLLEAVESLACDPHLRVELGNKGFQAYRRLWSAESHIHHYFRLIKEIAHIKNFGHSAFAGR
jgi:glycosyltransferase involved in cell wall biosynthesis